MFNINAYYCIGDIADILGCKVEQLPITYLGLPLGAKKNDQNLGMESWIGVEVN